MFSKDRKVIKLFNYYELILIFAWFILFVKHMAALEQPALMA
jgi:hypothetical protein